MASRNVRLITKRTSVPGKIPTGTTAFETNFIRSGELASNLADKKLFGYDGTNVFEYGTNSFLNITGGTVTGNLEVTGNFSATTLFSGSTNLEEIIKNLLTASNIGSGVEIFKQKSGVDFEFRTISGGTGITILSGDTNTFNIDEIERSIIINDESIFKDTAGSAFLGVTTTSFASFAGTGGINEAGFTLQVPVDYKSGGEFSFIWTMNGASVNQGRIAFNITTGLTTNNEHTNIDETIAMFDSGYTGVAWRILQSPYSATTISLSPEEYIHIQMLRDPANVSDTLTQTMYVSGVEFKYIATR